MTDARDKRVHGREAAGAGDIDNVDESSVLGPCPSCGAELLVAHVKHPHTGHDSRALMHPIPFCTYYGVTDPAAIERDVEERAKESVS